MAEPEAPGSAALDVKAARKRVLRSLKHHKEAMDRFLPAFLQALAPVDQAQSRALLKRLSTMAQEGEAPSFAGCPALPRPPVTPPPRPSCPCRVFADGHAGLCVRRSGSAVGVHPEAHGASVCPNE